MRTICKNLKTTSVVFLNFYSFREYTALLNLLFVNFVERLFINTCMYVFAYVRIGLSLATTPWEHRVPTLRLSTVRNRVLNVSNLLQLGKTCNLHVYLFIEVVLKIVLLINSGGDYVSWPKIAIPAVQAILFLIEKNWKARNV